MKKKIPILAQKFRQYCEANKHKGDSEEIRDELINSNHMKVLEQNKQYFASKKKQVEDQRRRDNVKLEDLIQMCVAQINSTVNKVVGDSGDESEYIEEAKVPHEILRKRYWEDRPSSVLPLRRTKRVKYDSQFRDQSVSWQDHKASKEEEVKLSKMEMSPSSVIQSLFQSSNKKA